MDILLPPPGCRLCRAPMVHATKTGTILACPHCDLMQPKGPLL